MILKIKTNFVNLIVNWIHFHAFYTRTMSITMLQIDNICIYDLNCNKLITNFTNTKLKNLKDGILCFDNESKLKFG